jgi:hypothetical protein
MRKPNNWNLPRFIAICGYPKSGKSTVQEILSQNYGVQPVDDGGPLREIAMMYLGLTPHQVFTQEGKNERVFILNNPWTVREILGELGNRFEGMFGKHIMPYMATRQLEDGPYSFGSVRRDQGLFYKQHGGVVLGVRNPDAKPSGFEFDEFDASVVDYWITNDFLARGMDPHDARLELAKAIQQVINQIMERRSRA